MRLVETMEACGKSEGEVDLGAKGSRADLTLNVQHRVDASHAMLAPPAPVMAGTCPLATKTEKAQNFLNGLLADGAHGDEVQRVLPATVQVSTNADGYATCVWGDSNTPILLVPQFTALDNPAYLPEVSEGSKACSCRNGRAGGTCTHSSNSVCILWLSTIWPFFLLQCVLSTAFGGPLRLPSTVLRQRDNFV